MEELKQCPFCGRDAKLIDLYPEREWFVSCSSRNCIEQKGTYRSKRSAVMAWNRRVVGGDAGAEVSEN